MQLVSFETSIIRLRSSRQPFVNSHSMMICEESGHACCHPDSARLASKSVHNPSRDFWKATDIPVAPWRCSSWAHLELPQNGDGWFDPVQTRQTNRKTILIWTSWDKSPTLMFFDGNMISWSIHDPARKLRKSGCQSMTTRFHGGTGLNNSLSYFPIDWWAMSSMNVDWN